MDFSLTTLLITALPLVLAMVLFGVAQARVAYYLGDKTAFEQGRASFNPLRHLNNWGAWALPVFLFVLSGGKFIFALFKSVPLNPENFKNPRADLGLVAIAGPLCVLLQGFVWVMISMLLPRLFPGNPSLAQMAIVGVQVNVMLCAFTLLPLPPFNGANILVSVLPIEQAKTFLKIAPYGLYIFIGLLVMDFFTPYGFIHNWLLPISTVLTQFLHSVASLFFIF